MKVKKFFKQEIVMVISFVLAAISLFFVHPDKDYAGYIDFRTLGILLSLMLVVAGLKHLGVFASFARFMIARTDTAKGMVLALVLMCFFLSMFITNDVALITFVPFAIELLIMSSLEKYMIPTIVLETIAANLGSMLTPMGNPQNLFLYTKSGMTFLELLLLMLPYALISLALLVVATLVLIGKEPTEVMHEEEEEFMEEGTRRGKLILYVLLFLVCLLTVLRLLPYEVVLAMVLLLVLLFDHKNLGRADYCLLLTFTFLFVFIGNMGRIPAVNSWLSSVVSKHTLVTAVISSQFISNVPAAILLSGFTDNLRDLIVGVNLGGLGTLIASMASLISFKFYAKEQDAKASKYLGYFTIMNIAFLAILLVATLLF